MEEETGMEAEEECIFQEEECLLKEEECLLQEECLCSAVRAATKNIY